MTSGHELLFSVSFFCTRLVRVTFSVVLSNSLNSGSRSLFSGREECLQYASQMCEA